MSITILEVLENVEKNINSKYDFLPNKKNCSLQLKNAITLLKKGYTVFDDIQPLLEKYKIVENIPEKNKINHL